MSLGVIIYILFSHWVCDFILQSDYEASNKSKSLTALLLHTVTYSISMGIFIEILFLSNIFGAQDGISLIYFTLFIFVTHTMVDFVTSKITTNLWKNKKVRAFFDVIGFDQLLHYVTIFFVIDYLFY